VLLVVGLSVALVLARLLYLAHLLAGVLYDLALVAVVDRGECPVPAELQRRSTSGRTSRLVPTAMQAGH
jgi:hypothetical protein